jgi:ribosome maturation factor RimP
MLNSQALTDLLDPVVAPMGLRVLSANWRAKVLDLRLEHFDASAPSLDEIAEASKAVSGALDDEPAIGEGEFTLEVSSPGLERPLIRLAHFEWALGRDVRFRGPDGVVKGRLLRVLDDVEPAIEVMVDAKTHTYALRDVSEAQTVFEWGSTNSQKDGRRQVDGA